MNRMLNIGLRGLTLGSKFILIFFLARLIEPADLGLYGLLTATISYALYILGLDFYTFTTREIIKRQRHEWGGLLKSQAALVLVLYVVFLPLLILIFMFELLPWDIAAWFFALLVLEHLNQELSRLWVTISRQLTASVVIFIRLGAWAPVAIIWMSFNPEARNLQTVLFAWAAGCMIALLVNVFWLAKLRIGGWHKKVDWNWIGQGLKIALPLLLATLALRSLFTVDRYWFEILNNREILGSYVLFMGICNALLAFLDAGVYTFSYPSLIKHHNKADASSFRREMHNLFTQTIGVIVAFSMISLFLISPLLLWLNKPIYMDHQVLFYWLLAAVALYGINMVPHYGLYAQGKDRSIIHSHMGGLLAFFLSVALIARYSPYFAVPVGLCCAFALMLFWKTLAYYKVTAST